MKGYVLSSEMLGECRKLALDRMDQEGVKPLYVVVSGSHMYGFPSRDSDLDIRCCHMGGTRDMFHLHKKSSIFQWKDEVDGVLVEFESFEVENVINLALKNNSNILEHIFAKNLLAHEPFEGVRLRELAKKSLSKQVYLPYNGIADFNYNKFIKSKNPCCEDKLVKKYLYVMRAYLAGSYALLHGDIEPNIVRLIEKVGSYLDNTTIRSIKELIDKKRASEYLVTSFDHARLDEDISKLKTLLEMAKEESKFPDDVGNRDNWDDLLYNIRLTNM